MKGDFTKVDFVVRGIKRGRVKCFLDGETYAGYIEVKGDRVNVYSERRLRYTLPLSQCVITWGNRR